MPPPGSKQNERFRAALLRAEVERVLVYSYVSEETERSLVQWLHHYEEAVNIACAGETERKTYWLWQAYQRREHVDALLWHARFEGGCGDRNGVLMWDFPTLSA